MAHDVVFDKGIHRHVLFLSLSLVFIYPVITMRLGTVSAAGQAVEVWYSGEDSQSNAGDAVHTLSKQPNVTVQPNDGQSITTIAIDTQTTFQPYTGFGIAMDETACYFLSRLGSSERSKVMNALFNPIGGSGINMVRVCVGTSDLTTRPFYSYNDMPSGQTDPTLSKFSIQKDIDYNIIARVKDALAINPDIKVFGSPWSPPGWMKSTGSLVGGKLKSEYYTTYAKYLVKFIKAYKQQGIDIYAITPQNEPDYVPENYPGCRYSPQELIKIIDEIATEFAANNIATKIWALDHNWDLWSSFAKTILDNPKTKSQVDGTAFHPYAGTVSAMTSLHNAHPDKSIHFTEKSRKNVDDADLIIQDFRNWAESATMWAVVGDGNGTGNVHYKFTHCPVIVKSATNYILGDEVFIFGQFARFIRRGALRVKSDYGSTGTVTNVCFRNPDGSLVVVLCNQNTTAKSFKLVIGEHMIKTSLPALTVATLTWTPGAAISVRANSKGLSGSSHFRQYPDMTSKTLRIRFDQRLASQVTSIAIFNAQGKNLYAQHNPVLESYHWSYDLSGHKPGIYVTHILYGETLEVVPFGVVY